MPVLVAVNGTTGTVLFEAESGQAEIEEIGSRQRVEEVVVSTSATLANLAEEIRDLAVDLGQTMEALSATPEGRSLSVVEVQMGLKIGAEGNAFVAKASAEGNVSVKLTWTFGRSA